MNYNLIISEEKKLVSVSPEGNYNLKEIRDLINIVVNDPHYSPDFGFLVDMTKLSYIPVISEIYSISDFIISIKHSFLGKTAMITGHEVLYNLFKLSAMFVSKQGLRSRIFRNYEDALLWLNEFE